MRMSADYFYYTCINFKLVLMMKKIITTILPIFILVILISCSESIKVKPVQRVIFPAFREILDSAQVTGAILVFDTTENTYYSNDFTWCETGRLPASTFKIPNSIIALETGVMESDSTLIKWDGEKRRLGEWERDLYFRDAFRVSCVPCYQEIARKIGVDRMKAYLAKLNYGHMIVDSASVDRFWLEGESKINPFEQIDFLKRIYYSELPISSRTETIMKRMLFIGENDSVRLSGKTGWSIRNGNNNGWFVGYAEIGRKVLFIATNINPDQEFNMDLFPVIRKEISEKAIRIIADK
jgi:beta-lactamase class D